MDKTLTLDKVTFADQAVYICEGENSIGSARTMAKLSVNCKCSNHDSSFYLSNLTFTDLLLLVPLFQRPHVLFV